MIQLRPYQEQAKDAVLGEWDNGIQKTLLVLPTGCGKTVVFAKIIEEQVRKGNRVLIWPIGESCWNKRQINWKL